MPWKDPEVLGQYFMAGAGAGLYGLYLFAVRQRSGAPITIRDLGGVALNVACAAACGLILTAVLANRLAALIPWPSLRDAGLVAFAFGVFGWTLLPLMFPKAISWAEKAADKIGGGE